MDCLTASGVTEASRTVSTVCERRVGASGLVGVPFAFCGMLSPMVLSVGLPVSTSAIARDAGDTSAAVETSGCVAGEISIRAGALSCTAFCAAALAMVCAAGETVPVCVSGTVAVSVLWLRTTCAIGVSSAWLREYSITAFAASDFTDGSFSPV